MQRAYAPVKVQSARPTVVMRPTSSARAARSARKVVVYGAPEKEQIDKAVEEAEEACAGGDQGEW